MNWITKIIKASEKIKTAVRERVTAKDLNEAYIKAAYIKKLAPMHFKQLFDVQEINE